MVKTPPPTLARVAVRSSTSKSTNTKSTTTTGASASSRSSGNLTSEDDKEINGRFDYNDNDNDEIQEVAAPVAKTPHPVEEATLVDVVVAKLEEDEPLSLVQKEVRGQETYRTRIRSFAGHNITGITLTIIQHFCNLNKIKGAEGKRLHSETKNVCCERIIQYIDHLEAAAPLPQTKSKSLSTSTKDPPVNLIRLINVPF